MLPIEVFEKAEDAYPGSKPLDLNQRQIILDYLKRYSPEQLDQLISATIENSKYFPRVADYHDTAKDLNIVLVLQKREPDETCAECDGAGWVYMTLHDKYGSPIKCVRPCSCFPRPKYEPEPELELIPF